MLRGGLISRLFFIIVLLEEKIFVDNPAFS